MHERLGRVYSALAGLFALMPVAIFVAVGLSLLGLGLYAGQHAWHSLRIVLAVVNAPSADLRSSAAGMVKLQARAQPPPARAGAGPVWYFRESRSKGGGSTLATNGYFLLQDEHGQCAVDSGEAIIVATTSESKHAFLDSSSTTVEKAIHAGDPVFAIGELKRRMPAPAGMPGVQCRLAPSGGVLLVSGSPQRYVLALYGLWFVVQATLALLPLSLLALGVWLRMGRHPGDSLST